jgi:hypothetical protein
MNDPIRTAVDSALADLFPQDRWIRLDEVIDLALAILRVAVTEEVGQRFGYANDEDGAYDMARDDAACGLTA